ncbi:hypothetical protein [Mycobacterium sp. NPDC050853]|uniref:hypothetical protein n=1 Tax=Mycobacterium sp. NPDC050853 TaxID=3155160 RepID=UPI0033E0718E
MFDNWCDPPGVKILHRVDRPVVIYTHQVWPSAGHSMRLGPLDARRHGLRIESLQPGRQAAWVRLDTGEWLALVFADVETADGRSKVTMQLWLKRHMFRPI